MLSSSNLVCRLTEVPSKIPTNYFKNINKVNLKFSWRHGRACNQLVAERELSQRTGAKSTSSLSKLQQTRPFDTRKKKSMNGAKQRTKIGPFKFDH